MINRTVLSLLFVLVASAVHGQIATQGQALAFDYLPADITSAQVVRFEMSIDGAAFVDVGMPAPFTNAQTAASHQTRSVAIPALVPGKHTAAFRACSAALCGNASPPFAFELVVKPATPVNVRIIPG